MKKRTLVFLGALTLMAMMCFTAYSQSEEPIKYNSLSATAAFGIQQFYGDVAGAVYFPGGSKEGAFSWDGQLILSKYFTPYFGVSLFGGMGKLSSQEKESKVDASYFDADIIDYGLNFRVNLGNIFFPKKYEKKLSWELFGGIGRVHYRTLRKTIVGDFYANSYGYKNNGTDKASMIAESIIIVGGGLKYRITNQWAVGGEMALKGPSSDKLDAASHTLSERDKYGYINVGVTYTFGKNTKYVSMQYNPRPAEELVLERAIEKTNKRIDSLNSKVNEMKPKLDGLVEDYDKRNGPDDDEDGVPNGFDLEPNTPKGALVNFQGVTIPKGGDEGGKYKIGTKPGDNVAYVSIYFPLNSTFISPDNMKKIATVAAVMKSNPDIKFEVVGTACRLASEEYNMNLSKKRADAAIKVLTDDFGIDASRVIIKYIGMADPAVDRNELLYLNRRVDFIMAK